MGASQPGDVLVFHYSGHGTQVGQQLAQQPVGDAGWNKTAVVWCEEEKESKKLCACKAVCVWHSGSPGWGVDTLCSCWQCCSRPHQPSTGVKHACLMCVTPHSPMSLESALTIPRRCCCTPVQHPPPPPPVSSCCAAPDGRQVPSDAEEHDGKDEALCPTDMNTITDDDLRVIFSKLADGVKFTMIAGDCSHPAGLLSKTSKGGRYTPSWGIAGACVGGGTSWACCCLL